MERPSKAPEGREDRLLELREKGVKKEMNGGENEKKGEEGLEICETGENILP